MTSQSQAKSKIESSLNVRLASLVLSLLSISLACHYAMVPRPLAFVYLFTCLFGSFCAYYFRRKGNIWLTIIAVLGTLLVMGNFAQEVFFQFYVGRLNPVGPFISVLAGLLALHTLDLRTRFDINIAAMIGLGLMACIGMLANDIIFGISILIYLLVAALLLYFECIASSLDGVAKRTRDETSGAYGVAQTNIKRTITSNVFVIASLPVFALLLFLNLPRIDSLIDRLVVELTSRGFPFRVVIVGATELVDNAFGNATLSDIYGRGPGAGQGPNSGSASLGGSSSGGAGMQERNSWQLQLDSAKNGGRSSGKPTASASAYGLGASGENPRSGQRKPGAPVNPQFNQPDPTKQEEMMLLYGNKQANAQDATVLFTMRCPREVFLKRLVFNYFDGHRWQDHDGSLLMTIDLTPDTLSDLTSAPTLLRPVVGSVDVLQEITAQVNIGHIIPAAIVPQRLEFPSEQIFVDQYGSLRAPIDITAGTKFKVISKTPLYNPRNLALNTPTAEEERLARAVLKNDLQIPADLSTEVRDLAGAIIGSEKNWFSQAERICNYLRNNFEYSLTPLKPGSSDNLVNQFLLVNKKGDCTHFATAFVMLCRSLGIPSRCVGGFAPGTRNLVSGLTEVRWRNSHAWAEVYIPRLGWVPFDAVPGGYLPADRPERNMFSALAQTSLAKSLAQAVERAAKSKGLRRPDEELEEQEASAIATRSNPAGLKNGKQSTNQSNQSAPTIQVSPGPSASELLGKPLLRIEGMTVGHSQQAEGGFLPKFMHLGAQLNALDLNWLTTYWRPLALAAILTGLVIVSLTLWRQNLPLFKDKRSVAKKIPPKQSSLAFIRVMKDLTRLKVKRAKGETANEVVDKVVERLAEIGRTKWQETLPGLLRSFMEIYCLNRFAETESAHLTAKLLDIEKEIHLLLTSA
ncbi:MAG: hypothetical protein C5B53_00440 [Candidatus Melainabacteria bacterium]|nr:MAG: hypothetical protein C5B53_00440 [Candidatus Melainabacteria bacterium]